MENENGDRGMGVGVGVGVGGREGMGVLEVGVGGNKPPRSKYRSNNI